MDPLTELLAGESSELQRLGQAALAGLRAALLHGLAHADHADPNRPAVQAAVAYLDHLPANGTANAPHPVPAPDPPMASPATPAPLASPSSWPRLLAEWQKRPDAGSLAKLAPDVPDLSKPLWLFTWRLPPTAATGLREAWQAAAGAAAPPTPPATLDARLREPPTTPVARRMADVVSRLLWFADNDPSLWHMLRSVYRFGLVALGGPQRDRYTQALVNRYDLLRQAEDAGDARGLLTAWVDLDEAAHSLTYQPVAHPQSDFARIARAGREVLGEVRDQAVRAGLSFHLQCPSGRYADLKGLTDPDADVAVDAGGAPGDVVLCARLFLRLDDAKHPGRVVYRTR